MKSVSTRQTLDEGIRRLLAGQHHDPFEVLGCHRVGRRWRIRALLPGSAGAGVLIDGELLVTPSPRPEHQEVAGEIYTQLKKHVRAAQAGKVYMAPVDVQLSNGEIVQPDVLFVRRERLDIVDRRIHGAPDLVIEVASPSNADRDRFLKRSLHATNGVPEYWIVDLEDRSVQVLELDGDAYREAGWFQT